MPFELACCEKTLLADIADRNQTQADVAKTYTLAIMSSGAEIVDWHNINRAIITRWSRRGLERIKRLAHKGTK